MKLYGYLLTLVLLVWISQAFPMDADVGRHIDGVDLDNMEMDDDFSTGLNLHEFSDDIQREIGAMTRHTKEKVASVLGVNKKALDRANYRKSHAKSGTQGPWKTEEYARVLNKAKPGESSKYMAYAKNARMESTTVE